MSAGQAQVSISKASSNALRISAWRSSSTSAPPGAVGHVEGVDHVVAHRVDPGGGHVQVELGQRPAQPVQHRSCRAPPPRSRSSAPTAPLSNRTAGALVDRGPTPPALDPSTLATLDCSTGRPSRPSRRPRSPDPRAPRRPRRVAPGTRPGPSRPRTTRWLRRRPARAAPARRPHGRTPPAGRDSTR